MPELPEVETIARDLRPRITGAMIAGVRCDWPRVLRSHEPVAFEEAVVGRRIEGVGRRGKQLLVPLSGGDLDSEPAVLTVHLKMTGQLFVVPATHEQDGHVHLVFELDDGRELRFRDIRKFGRVGLYRRDALTGEPMEGEAIGVLATGAEPLAGEFTPAAVAAVLKRRRGRLKPTLLDQAVVAGVGNIYADESLWRARLHPLRQVSTLRPDEVRRLHAALREVLEEAVRRRGSSVDDYTAPDGDGSMQEYLQVYQRAGEDCLRCGRPIRRIVVGGRSTHFCSWCQRLSGDERRSAEKVLRSGLPKRRGPRWTELSGEGAIGRTGAEEKRAVERARRVAAQRKAAATRRAAARGTAESGSSAPTNARAPEAVPTAARSTDPIAPDGIPTGDRPDAERRAVAAIDPEAV